MIHKTDKDDLTSYLWNVIIRVKPEHIDKGVQKYKGVRDETLEALFTNAKIKSEVYRFEDGRYLVNYLSVNQAFLYPDKEALLSKIQLG